MIGNDTLNLKRVLFKEKTEAAVQKLQTITASVIFVSMTKTKEVAEKERNELLKEKYHKIKRGEFIKKHVAPPCRCAHIKSVGNGL